MNISLELAKSTTLSSILSDSQKAQIIENKYHELLKKRLIKKFNPESLWAA